MRRIDFLLTQARRQTENEEFSATTGINDEELLQYVNDAQYRMLSLITSTHPTVFVKESADISVVTDQEQYSLPDDVFLENRISAVEFSSTNLDRDFRKLEPITLAERSAGARGFPNAYIRRSGKILLSPIPSTSTGKLRINYVRRIAEIDKRRGKISAVTLNNTLNTITSLTIDTSEENFDFDTLTAQDFISIVDKNGVQQMVAIDIDSLNESTGVVTVNSTFVFAEGETIVVGDFVCAGKNNSTHSELPKICERYLIAYIAWKILKKDSSEDSFEQRNEIKSMETDILEAFGDTTDDLIFIPQIEREF